MVELNPIERRLADLEEAHFFARELSWLSFNARVLQEARDPDVPMDTTCSLSRHFLE
jgi:Polyphosphate kinase